MNQVIYILILLSLVSFSCSAPLTQSEQFCKCFTKAQNQDFNIRTEKCNAGSQKMDIEFSLDLIASCDSYFKAVLNLQAKQISKRATQDLEKLSKAKSPSDEFQLAMSLNTAVINTDFESALKLSLQLKEQYSDNLDYRFLKAFAHEQLGQYNKAIEEYNDLNTVTNSNRYKLSIAIANRRKNH